MRFLTLIFASIVPGLLWVWFFYRQDRYDKEPVRLVLITFVAGMVAVVPAALLEAPFRDYFASPTPWFTRLLVALFVVGLGEETVKLLAVLFTAYRHRAFNEPVDGIVYAVSASLGFAALENLFYVMGFGLEVAPVRAVVTTLAHASFGGIAGLFLGLARRSWYTDWGLVLQGLLIAAGLHGIYDFIIIARLAHPLIALVMVGFAFRFVVRSMKQLQRRRHLR